MLFQFSTNLFRDPLSDSFEKVGASSKFRGGKAYTRKRLKQNSHGSETMPCVPIDSSLLLSDSLHPFPEVFTDSMSVANGPSMHVNTSVATAFPIIPVVTAKTSSKLLGAKTRLYKGKGVVNRKCVNDKFIARASFDVQVKSMSDATKRIRQSDVMVSPTKRFVYGKILKPESEHKKDLPVHAFLTNPPPHIVAGYKIPPSVHHFGSVVATNSDSPVHESPSSVDRVYVYSCMPYCSKYS
ncbi:hypothetical protein Scep_014608 [Stephania cephalantha]|uniref:Uncharacterized protein n=1 Tax=Stephania cephalantha TaxID=152367 RepID=A0AAP0J3N0_9MAGN